MPIVKYTNPKTGVVYAYESTGRWNPQTQRNEPVRTYLGRVDPETGEIIPTGGKRGRKRRTPAETGEETPASSAQYENAVQSLEHAQRMLNDQQERIRQLETENAAMKAVLSSIANQTAQFASCTTLQG
jgi:hypothetical protein